MKKNVQCILNFASSGRCDVSFTFLSHVSIAVFLSPTVYLIGNYKNLVVSSVCLLEYGNTASLLEFSGVTGKKKVKCTLIL